jgi:tRNA(Ile)-lysidine synthase
MKKKIDPFDLNELKVQPPVPLAVAFSGGADSTALLLACINQWPNLEGQAPRVRAIHIHHGLQAAADSFAEHCTRTCRALGVPLHIEHVQAKHLPGESPEEAARLARYKAFAGVVHGVWGAEINTVLLGQHADDQAETLILALSRGAGLPGLASMAPQFERFGVNYYRPFLQISALQIREWLSTKDVPWIEDPTNQDTQYTRNKIRLQIMPALSKAFPSFRETFARSASHAAQAQSLLDELAAEDLLITGNPPQIKTLQSLSPQRVTNVLRFWFKSLGTSASSTQMNELLSQIKRCKTRGHQIELKLGRGFVVREGAHLSWSELLQ